MLELQHYQRKSFPVECAQVTDANVNDVAEWCKGSIQHENGKRYIKVDVHNALNPRQTKAFVGDWVLFAGKGFKVYTGSAFDSGFEKVKQPLEHQSITNVFAPVQHAAPIPGPSSSKNPSSSHAL